MGGADSNMRLAYAATYLRPGPQELLEAHMTICASHIIKYRRRMCLAYSRTYQHSGPHRLCEAHSAHMRLAYLIYRRRI